MNLSEKFWQQILFSCFLINNNRTNLQRVECSPIEILNLDFETLDSQYASAKHFFSNFFNNCVKLEWVWTKNSVPRKREI